MKLLDMITGKGRGQKVRTSGEVRAAMEEGRTAVARMRTELEALEGPRRTTLITATDDEVAALDREIAAARIRIERAEAAEQEGQKILKQAEAREEDERRQRLYQHGLDAQVRAEAALTAYEVAARDVVQALADLAEAEAAVFEANANLPEGSSAIASPEFSARKGPDRGPEVSERRAPEVGLAYQTQLPGIENGTWLLRGIGSAVKRHGVEGSAGVARRLSALLSG